MKRITVTALGALASLMVLSACEPGPFDPNDPNKNRRQGAIGGAVAGAAAGAILGDGKRSDEMLAGAIVGGLVGGAIGNNLDRQAAELDRDLGNRVDVIRQGNELIVRMPQDILFEVDSAALRPDLRADLRTLADSLQRYPETSVIVVGHTDNTGSAEYNQLLSERRAGAVRGVLVNNGVDSFRIQALGAGEDQPIATNQTPEGRALNRRVDIRIIGN